MAVNGDGDADSGPPIQGRGQAFGMGMASGGSPSMLTEAERYNAQVPRAYKPSGTSNGMGLEQYKQTLGGAFPAPNGISVDNYETMRYFGRNQ